MCSPERDGWGSGGVPVGVACCTNVAVGKSVRLEACPSFGGCVKSSEIGARRGQVSAPYPGNSHGGRCLHGGGGVMSRGDE